MKTGRFRLKYARFEVSCQNGAFFGARSLVWLERPAHNRAVRSSNLLGPIPPGEVWSVGDEPECLHFPDANPKHFYDAGRIGQSMQCPACGKDCIRPAHEIVALLPTIFAPCERCESRLLDKSSPLGDQHYREPCLCQKRFIDEVFAHLYTILVEEGILSPSRPLKDVGYPLVHPGFAMNAPPFLPRDSLVLLSPVVTKGVAERMVRDVPEIKGVVHCGSFIPGAVDVDLTARPQVYKLLAGCDVRADVFTTQISPIVIYKQQSLLHIEFPRGYDPKIIGVGVHVKRTMPRIFVDACCGAGTLGILAGTLGVPRVILNDAWYAAAFWAAMNLEVNRENLLIEKIQFHRTFPELETTPIRRESVLVAEATGEQELQVYQGDFHRLPDLLPAESGILTAIDLYDKADPTFNRRLVKEWRERTGGEVFIP